MSVAVLKNRLLDLTDREFRESDYGAATFLEFVRLESAILDIDVNYTPPKAVAFKADVTRVFAFTLGNEPINPCLSLPILRSERTAAPLAGLSVLAKRADGEPERVRRERWRATSRVSSLLTSSLRPSMSRVRSCLTTVELLGDGVVGGSVLRAERFQPNDQPDESQQHADVGGVHALHESRQ